jgi:hypothetical protein
MGAPSRQYAVCVGPQTCLEMALSGGHGATVRSLGPWKAKVSKWVKMATQACTPYWSKQV